MTPELYVRLAVVPALSLLPAPMDTPSVRAMMVAIALQETDLEHRRQLADGPARGYTQFELGITKQGKVVGGLAALLKHAKAGPLCAQVVNALDYGGATPQQLHAALEHNDVLAAAFTRLLLWTVPWALPTAQETTKGWEQYEWAWRPGMPRPEKWPRCFARAWEVV